LALVVAKPSRVACTDAVQAILQVLIPVFARNLDLLFGIQLFFVAVRESIETFQQIMILGNAPNYLQLLCIQCRSITGREVVQTVRQLLRMRTPSVLCSGLQGSSTEHQQCDDDPICEFHKVASKGAELMRLSVETDRLKEGLSWKTVWLFRQTFGPYSRVDAWPRALVSLCYEYIS
jgi:hypothetical protein